MSLNTILITILILIFAFVILIVVARSKIIKLRNWDPTFWNFDIRRIKRRDIKNPPDTDIILFIRSSTIRFWKTLNEDMSPLKVLNLGFGGSRISDILYYFNQLVTPYTPKGIVFYAGENDIAGIVKSSSKTAEQVRDDFVEFCKKVHKKFPKIPIFYISIKPPNISRRKLNEIQKANELINNLSLEEENYHFIDINPILTTEGKLKEDVSRKDGIHLNEKGYKFITSVIKPILFEHFN